MKTIKIKAVSHIKEAVASAHSKWDCNDPHTQKRLEMIQRFQSGIYLTEQGEVIYLIRPRGEQGTIVHRFEDVQGLNNHLVRRVEFNPEKTEMYILDGYQEREDLRKRPCYWTMVNF